MHSQFISMQVCMCVCWGGRSRGECVRVRVLQTGEESWVFASTALVVVSMDSCGSDWLQWLCDQFLLTVFATSCYRCHIDLKNVQLKDIQRQHLCVSQLYCNVCVDHNNVGVLFYQVGPASLQRWVTWSSRGKYCSFSACHICFVLCSLSIKTTVRQEAIFFFKWKILSWQLSKLHCNRVIILYNFIFEHGVACHQ